MALYGTFKLEEGMCTTGRDFTRTPEELDPPMNCESTPLSGLDAYQRQLRRFDIRVGGPGSDLVEKFFQISDSVAFLPEYVSRAVRQGIERVDLLLGVVAMVMKINSMDYHTIASDPLPQDKELLPVVEGAEVPCTVVKTQESLVRLHKHGHMLMVSHEALYFQKLDLFTVTLRQVDAYIACAQPDDVVNVLLDGDGNGNPVPVTGVIGGFLH